VADSPFSVCSASNASLVPVRPISKRMLAIADLARARPQNAGNRASGHRSFDSPAEAGPLSDRSTCELRYGLPPLPPPAKKTTACEDYAGQSSTDNRARGM
jgi:hypothetical protein